ncbi:MAG: hypothetical protein CVV42_04530 [Candidatus Riflebacteria bacterium HGW-Riflebacteria-2]|jgi:uncharacterized protein YutE (UPF0331/DUF86 family)|nr:MAG: hypothetical protein CVV42_04530 [Candidatus Riflebacteria bacterium HGW-Riflebacteria-2]
MNASEDSLQALKTLRLRYVFSYALLLAFRYMTFYNFVAGFLFLLLRQLRLASIDFIGFSLAGIPVCLLAALAVACRCQLEEGRAMALLDSHNRSGGLLLAEFETGDRSWNRRHGSFTPPRLHLNLNRRWPAWLVSLLFIALSVTIPVRQVAGDRDPRLDLKEMQQTATAQVEALKEAGLIDEKKADELKETIEQITAASDRNDPSKTFEAFDQLQEKMRKDSATGAEKMLSEQEDLQTLQSLTDQLKNADSPEKMRQAIDALREKLEQCGMDAAAMKQPGSDSLEEKMQQAGSGAAGASEAATEAAQQLQDYMQQRAEEMRAAAEKLVKARLLDRKTYEKLKQEGRLRPATEADLAPGSGADLVIAPADVGGESGDESGGESGGESGDGKPGSGSQGGQPGLMVVEPMSGSPSGQAGRDGGTAPLNFSRQSSEHSLKFKDEALPTPASADLQDSVAIGMAISAPQVETSAGQSSSGPVDWQKSDKSGGESDVILPRHRSAVKRYFERKVPTERRQK